MIRHRIEVSIALGLLLAAGGCRSNAPGPEAGFLVVRLQAEDADTRRAAAAEAHLSGPRSAAAVIDLLDHDDPDVRKTARQALSTLAHHSCRKGAEWERRLVSAACLDALEQPGRIPDTERAELFRIVSWTAADRSAVARIGARIDDQRDAEMAYFALSRAGHPEAQRQLLARLPAARAIRALGPDLDEAAVEDLFTVARGTDAEAAHAARRALAAHGDQRARDLLIEALVGGASGATEDLLRFAAARQRRGDPDRARQVYAALLGQQESHLVAAAVAGLGEVGDPRSTSTLIPLLRREPVVRTAAEQALAQISGESVHQALVVSARDDHPSVRSSALRLLAERGAPEAAGLLLAALSDDDDEVLRTAVELLSRRSDPVYVERLFELAASRTGPEGEQILASLVEKAISIEQAGSPGSARDLLHRVLDTTRSDPIRSSALSRLAAIADPASLEPLAALEGLEKRDGFREALANARFAIALKLIDDRPEQARELLESVVLTSTSRARRNLALSRLEQLGVDTGEYSRRAGFVSRWHLLGPLPQATRENLGTHDLGEMPDLAAEHPGATGAVSWRLHQSRDMDGLIPLDQIYSSASNVTAFGLAVVSVESGQDALLKVGSDDGVAVWLNGELIHDHFVSRGVRVDQDRLEVRLKEGSNQILVKVSQGGGGWGFCVRLTDRQDRPLKFEEPQS